MAPPVSRRAPGSLWLVGLALLALGGCGDEIGDECSLSNDCSSSGERFCDTSAPGGYCTIIGCDHDSCPDEAVCVRFFSVTDNNRVCVYETEDVDTDDCTTDELCTLRGRCEPRSAEARFCMKTCGNDGDCRDGYECRDREDMERDGGEPVLAPTESSSELPSFCAAAPIDTLDG